MYNGYTDIGGWLFHLCGQPSGHVNTTIDNSLANMVVFAYHAWSVGMSIDALVNDVTCAFCGDDAIWADRTDMFEPESVNDAYNAFGFYLEFESLEPGLGTFVGTLPASRRFNGKLWHGYCNRVSRAVASAHFRKRERNALQHLSKLCSLAQKCFFNEQIFSLLKSMAFSHAEKCVKNGELSICDSSMLGELATLDELRNLKSYYGWVVVG